MNSRNKLVNDIRSIAIGDTSVLSVNSRPANITEGDIAVLFVHYHLLLVVFGEVMLLIERNRLFFRSIVSQYYLSAESAKVTENNRKGCKRKHYAQGILLLNLKISGRGQTQISNKCTAAK